MTRKINIELIISRWINNKNIYIYIYIYAFIQPIWLDQHEKMKIKFKLMFIETKLQSDRQQRKNNIMKY